MQQPLGLVLAGGLARRMGGVPKHGVMLGRETLLARCIARLEPQVGDVAISANCVIETPYRVLGDTMAGHLGPLAGLLAGLHWAEQQGATHIVSVAVDTPFFPCDLVPQLILAGLSHPQGFAVAGTAQGDNATFGLWPVAHRQALAAFLQNGGRKVRAFTRDHHAATALFGDDKAFFNINTPDDLEQAAAWL